MGRLPLLAPYATRLRLKGDNLNEFSFPKVAIAASITPKIHRKKTNQNLSKTKTYQNDRNRTTGFGFGVFTVLRFEDLT